MDLPRLADDAPISVVIPAWNAAGTLSSAVTSALAQEVDGPLDVVIAVADPADPADATADVAHDLARDERVRVVANPAGTAPSGLNAAIRAADGEVIVRLDAHATLPPGYIATAVDALRRTEAANVGGRQRAHADTAFGQAVAAAMASPAGAGGARYRLGGEPGPVETVYLGVFRRAALEQVGGFDERLLRNQDYELNHRLREAGGMVYFVPELEVGYRPRTSVGDLWRQYWDYGAWKRLVIRMHPASIRPRQLAAPGLVAALILAGILAVFGTWYLLPVLVGAYLLGLVAAGFHAAPEPSLGPATAYALAVMHLAWGSGFLVGRRRRAPSERLDGDETP